MQADGLLPSLPPAGAPWVVAWLLDAGPSGQGLAGAVPLDWREIDAWLRLTGTQARNWELQLLRRLSVAWCDQVQAARDPACPAPYLDPAMVAANRDAVDRKLKARREARLAAEKGNS